MDVRGRILIGFENSPSGKDAAALGHELSGLLGMPTEVVPVEQMEGRDEAAIIVLAASAPLEGGTPYGGFGMKVFKHARCAVAIAPFGYRDELPGITAIAAGLNDSDEARAALTVATQLGRQADLPVQVLTAVPRSRYRAAAARQTRDQLILSGSPARAISGAVTSQNLLILGSRGHGPSGRVLLGSCAALLAYAPPCPVLILPRRSEHRLLGTAPAASGDFEHRLSPSSAG